jgi:plastocyanin
MKFMKKIFFSMVLLSLLLACSKDKSVADLNGENISANAKIGTGPAIPQNTIHILSSGFSPDSVMVNINSTVTWINDDDKPHTVTSDKFDSGDILPGGTFSFAFDNTGTYSYFCKHHSERAKIVVAGIR